ncbi:transmembrane and coiled-coil domain-containing protein 4-like isoform X2 [Cimex lectularius]|uniref:Transmembrane and coiled-coil domain-containing protein 4 n=1 Tax=Cimex lectularius TaxID=79782 RepID=A0A8I6SGY5_CIMLE|nr:transmembrane and coiled-coil domain-containing protein 4-like isoform X2 [Cimex lectularius]
MDFSGPSFEGAEVGIDEKDIINLVEGLTDAGKYSYAGLCAITLHSLFYDCEPDRPFCYECLSCVVSHLGLPDSVSPIMDLLLKGEMSNSAESFLNVLNTEAVLEGNLCYVLQDLVTVAVQKGLSIGEYDSRWRVLIRKLRELMDVESTDVEFYEINVINCLTQERASVTEEERKTTKKRNRITKAKRYAMIALATIGGGTLIGVTGGLAAPLIGAGLGSVLGTSAIITGLTGAAGAAVFGTLFGAAGGGLAGYKMNKRVGEIEEFAFGQLGPYTDNGRDGVTSVTTPQLDITIALSGWINDESEDNFTKPWKTLYSSREQYYLRYESSYLLELGKAIEYFMSMVLTMATQEALKYTILSGLVSAISLPAGLMSLASVIDNPWGVCCRRSAQVGKHLAQVLLNREHGRRPVTLIGYSLGARALYYCLREMSERQNCVGLVQDAYLLGAPCTGNAAKWDKISKVVAGKLVNGYCTTDWLLRFLYRTLSMPRGGVAGLQPIAIESRRIVNHDLSHIVSGHGDYPDNMHKILKHIGVRVVEIQPITASKSHDDLLTVPQDVQIATITKSLSDSVILTEPKK